MRRLHEICTIEGCGRPHKSRGYCQTHYMQYKRGAPVVSEIKPRTPRDLMPDECVEAGCSDPVKAKGLCKTHYQRLLRRGHTRYHDRKKPAKECSTDGCTKILYSNGVCHSHYVHRRKLAGYGLTVAGYDQMADLQGNTCAICGRPETMPSVSGEAKRLAVDHCHQSGKVRGLLCSDCNTALGLLQDDPRVILRAADYLLKHSP